jgi:hypothetical protein
LRKRFLRRLPHSKRRDNFQVCDRTVSYVVMDRSSFPGLKIETWGTQRWCNFKRTETWELETGS